MNIHFVSNTTMDSMAERYFIPSLPSDFLPVPHRCDVATTGEYGKDGYYDVLVDKIEWILSIIEGSLDGKLMFWSDVDVIFNREIFDEMGTLSEEIESLAHGKDLLFQREWSRRNICNTGIQIIRRNTRTLVFYAQVRLMLEGFNRNDQVSINQLLQMIDGVEWGHLPLTYSSETNGSLSMESRLYHANSTLVDSMNSKWRLLSKAEQLWSCQKTDVTAFENVSRCDQS